MRRILLLILLVYVSAFVSAQIYTTTAPGNWSSSTTWYNGLIPPTTINSSQVVHINHRVIYNMGSDLNIEGGQLIITDTLRFPNNGNTGTGRSIFVKVNGSSVGLLSVSFGGLIMPVFLTDGSNNSGNMKAEGGRLEITYSYVEIGQNAEATSNSHRKFINTCIKLGENYLNSFSTDTLQSACIELGLHGSGNFQNDGGTIRFNMTPVLIRGSSGSFINSSVPTSRILTYASPPFAILTLDVPNHLENSGIWDAPIGDYCVGGSITGSQAGDIDFTSPENCVVVNETECFCNPYSIPLPVTIKSFAAQRVNLMEVKLIWETMAEQNNRGFNVQRRIGTGNWENTGFVASISQNGVSNYLLHYEFTDYNPINGLTQYRLQQVDIDDKYVYSIIRVVPGGSQDGGIIVYPNPSIDGFVTVVFEESNMKRNVSLIDMSGRTLKQWKNVADNLQIDNLLPGFYSLFIENTQTGKHTVEKLVVIKR